MFFCSIFIFVRVLFLREVYEYIQAVIQLKNQASLVAEFKIRISISPCVQNAIANWQDNSFWKSNRGDARGKLVFPFSEPDALQDSLWQSWKFMIKLNRTTRESEKLETAYFTRKGNTLYRFFIPDSLAPVLKLST